MHHGLAAWALLLLVFPAQASDAQEAALVFDGIDDLATIPAPVGWPGGSSTLTVEAWLKPSDVSGTWHSGVVWRENFGFVQKLGDNSSLGFLISRGPTDTVYTPSGSLVVGEWSHFAGTWDGTTMRIYKNGKLVNDKVHPAPGSVGFFSDLILGSWPDAGEFPGTMAEVRIWNTVRTEAEISAWMSRPLTGSEPDLLGYWRLDEGFGQLIADSTAFGNDGVLGTSDSGEPEDPLWTFDAPPLIGIFFDGFESGTTATWSLTVGG
jgi:hypothetical protein